jgi:16S rRNA processing protein RimM
MTAELLAIGSIVKAFGIKGELIVRPLTDMPERFASLKTVRVGRTPEDIAVMHITRAVIEPRGIRLRIRGINDRTAAEQLVGQLLFIDNRQRLRLPKGTFFVHEVVGLQVIDEEGRDLGSVREVLKYPAHDVYVVGHTPHDILIPAVKEFIRRIDVATGTMRVKVIEGMIEE